jgi:hypothetical protein
MNSKIGAESSKLTPATSGFVLAAAITVLFNTVLACAKDANAPLRGFLQSLTDHDWTTQGLIDLALFVGLGLIFMKTGITERMDPNRLTTILVGAVVIAGFGLALWYAFV